MVQVASAAFLSGKPSLRRGARGQNMTKALAV